MCLRSWKLTICLVLLSSLVNFSLGADGLTPLELLEERGLVKEGRFFILPIEQPLRAKILNLRPTMGEMEGKFAVWGDIVENENAFQYFTDQRISLIAQINDTRQQISQLNPREEFQKLERVRLQQGLVELDQNLMQTNTEIALRQKRLVSPAKKEHAETQFKDIRKVFLDKSGVIGEDYIKVKEAYVPIAEDTSIKAFLKAYNEQTRATLKLGPSDALKKGIGTILTYEKNYSPETALGALNQGKKSKKAKKGSGKISPLRSREKGTKSSARTTVPPRPSADESESSRPEPQGFTVGNQY